MTHESGLRHRRYARLVLGVSLALMHQTAVRAQQPPAGRSSPAVAPPSAAADDADPPKSASPAEASPQPANGSARSSAGAESPAAAQGPRETATERGPAQRYVDARRVDRLESSLAELAHSDTLVRRWGGAAALVLGSALIVGGVLVAAEDDGLGGRGRAAISGLAWSAGASLIAAGVYRWASHSPAEERFARWHALRSSGQLDLLEFARFEGELASEAEVARFGRGLSALSSLGLAAGGGGVIALGASSELDDDTSTDAYILGGVMLGVGVVQSVALFLFRTPAERAWRNYQGGGGFVLNRRLGLDPELVWAPEAVPGAL